MFDFFKKKDLPKKFGTFSAYGMEDVYYFLSDSRIKEKSKDLEDKPTLGTSFKKFISEECVTYPSGELNFFVSLLYYFSNDLDLALYLYNKSKEFSEFDYPKKDSLKVVWKEHLDTLNRILERNPEDKGYYISKKRPIYWLEYDMFYFNIIKNLISNFNHQKFSKLQIVGEFDRKGSKISTPEIEIILRSKRKPEIGYYLTFKNDSFFMDIKVNLIEIKQDQYQFETLFGSYQLNLSKEKAKISLLKSFSNQKITLIKSTTFKVILTELISNYIRNFDKISERYANGIYERPFNFFLCLALRIKDLDFEIKSKIESELISKKEIWGTLEQYYISSIVEFPMKKINRL